MPKNLPSFYSKSDPKFNYYRGLSNGYHHGYVVKGAGDGHINDLTQAERDNYILGYCEGVEERRDESIANLYATLAGKENK